MIETKYSTKEICQIFNFGRETLRHYERQGLLNPKINPDNGYREYSYWDICSIIDILKYRSFGFSLSDTKDVIFDFSYPKIIKRLEEHSEYFEDQITKYQMLLQKASKDLSYLRQAKDHMFELRESVIGDFFLVPYTTNPSDEYFSSMQKAFQNSQFFATTLTINETNHDLDCYGLITEREYANYLKIEKGFIIKKSAVVSQMIDIVGRTPADETIVKGFKETISGKYSRSFDTIYAVLVSRFYDDEKRYHQYFMAFAQLE
ncbi:MerR family transcriptional regulator [Butyrivibrio sp. AE2015]|uniref:MerR family transcriptional regulator n=1 Tax=Butyrivibrio sp. AE2015 TaxID=1280663 RepID=UPI0003B6B78D|nr:MerR family transcriptional regulator [Butyrivibrio sp. AE2015]